MRIATVLGKVSLAKVHPTLVGARWLLALPRRAADGSQPDDLVVLDEQGAKEGSEVAISEGAEAAVPFLPAKKPVDAYAAALLDSAG